MPTVLSSMKWDLYEFDCELKYEVLTLFDDGVLCWDGGGSAAAAGLLAGQGLAGRYLDTKLLLRVGMRMHCRPEQDARVRTAAVTRLSYQTPLVCTCSCRDSWNTANQAVFFTPWPLLKSVTKGGVGKWAISQHPLILILMGHAIKARSHTHWEIT